MKKSMLERIKIILKYFYVVTLIVIISSIGVMYFLSTIPNYFESKSVILLEDGNTYSYENMETYTKYFKTNNVLKLIINNLNLEDTVSSMNKNINIKHIKNTKLIEIKVKSKTPEISINISNELISEFQKSIKSIYPSLNIYTIENPTVNNGFQIDTNFYLIITVMCSFIMGCIIVSSCFNLNINIKNHEDLKKILNIKSLGIIPNDDSIYFDKKNKKKSSLNTTKIRVINDSSSITSEAYRMVRTNLDYLDLKVINFTSTSVGEGKSETIVNVATSFAMIGKKVLLIDCDLRKPKVHKNFNLNRAMGLTDILVYDRVSEYQKIIQSFKIINTKYKVDILSAGSKVSNPSELLSSKTFNDLIEEVKKEYDLILVDCPPVSLMTDAVIVSKVADGTVYVIEYDRINSSAIASGIDQLKDINANVLGGIITKVNINKQKKLYGNKYEYYYNNYMA